MVALPYVVTPNGVRRLASFEDVVVLPPTRTRGLRLTLSKRAIDAGTKGLQFVRVPAGRTDPACAELATLIRTTARANMRRMAWWTLAPLAGVAFTLVFGYARYRPGWREDASGTNAARLGTAERGAIQSPDAR